MNRTRTVRSAAVLGAILLGAAVLAGCSSAQEKLVLNVFAAASLNHVFTEIGRDYHRAHPEVEVRFNFAGSSALVTQINDGALADVLATADERTMDLVAEAADARIFATNTLVIVTAPENPEQITDFADLNRPGLRVAVCAPEVPCGAATETVERDTGVALSPVIQESSSSATLAKVTSGETDAGLVYLTDARSAGAEVDTVPDPVFDAVVNRYAITNLVPSGGNAADGRTETSIENSDHRDSVSESREAAQAFEDLVLGESGRRSLVEAGFGLPAQ